MEPHEAGAPELRVSGAAFTIQGSDMIVEIDADPMRWTSEKLVGGCYDGA